MGERYVQFLRLARELYDLEHAQGLLSWDQETNMPVRGAEQRARSTGLLAGIRHEKLTCDRFIDAVGELACEDLRGDAAVNVRLLKREQDRALRIPQELVVELSETQSRSHEVWVGAREQSDFEIFAPWLRKILELQKRVADLVGYEGSIYNAFLDEFEPYARVEEVNPVLSELRDRLIPLVERILSSGTAPKDILSGDFPVEAQRSFGRHVMTDMGFDDEAGRLDESVHPFCSGLAPTDVRLTTRYSSGQMTESLFGIIHECGHGLYEQGLPEEALGTPLCQAVSLGIHESQSRMWENMIGRSREFWEHYLPLLKQYFPGQLEGVTVDDFYAAINQVKASHIRVEADEVTYNLHILLRFELEQALVADDIEVAELPHHWNRLMQQYLGMRPKNDAEGVLQDIHWSAGLIGYFPTYSLGNLYAAQFFDSAARAVPDLMAAAGQGNFAELRDWLGESIHQRGSRLQASELILEVTGKPLVTEYLVDYLESKYGELYNL